MIVVQRALLSVYEKRGIVEFARALSTHGVEILSSGGTARALQAAGLAVTPLEKLTGFGDLFDGRVKTLTPEVHGGLLLRRDHAEDRRQAEAHGIRPIDLVCVNLYPFAETAARPDATRATCIEMIDVGGPAMIRAAAKNHRDVVVVTAPEQYAAIAALLAEHGGRFPREAAARLAGEAFARTASYDAAIHAYLRSDAELPAHWAAGGPRAGELRYGENPNQRAAWYRTGPVFWSDLRLHQGKEISYNNLADLWAGADALAEFRECACVVIKHRTPCGAALGESVTDAFARARDADSLSAFGGVVLVNRTGDGELARQLTEMFLEVVAAPEWTEEALAILARKKNLRVLGAPRAIRAGDRATLAFHSLGDAVLVQDPLPPPAPSEGWRRVTQAATDAEALQELFFAWRVVRHMRSNAIALTRAGVTLGLGAGQTSRIDACDNALAKAARCGHEVRGAVLASDAFFPFRDVVDRAAAAGVRAIVQPGGSVRDVESIAACDEHGLSMVFTGERAFAH
jgi:phosphoribosylaminoimidazolecarboxamide formyltransferase/IMP cyclohydrolase